MNMNHATNNADLNHLRTLNLQARESLNRMGDVLGMNEGPRKSSRDMLSPEQGKAFFAAQRRKTAHERSKAR